MTDLRTAVGSPDAPAAGPDHRPGVAPVAAVDPRPTLAPDGADAPPANRAPLTPRRLGVTVAAWVLLTVISGALVLYVVGPMLEQRDQRALLRGYRTDIRQAANQAEGLAGVEVPTKAPSTGAPVGVVEIGALRLQQVVVEGVGPQQTRRGPGHVPGTAGPGQPGNSALVGRRNLFGGAFGKLADIDPGDRILVTTTQGPSVYVVTQRTRRRIVEAETTSDSRSAPAEEVDPAGPARLPDGRVTVDDLYGPSPDDRLTLVTSTSSAPWTTDEVDVVVAEMDGVPFAPTPQGGRTATADGRHGDSGAQASLGLALALYIGAAIGAVALFRRVTWRSAHLLSVPLLVASTVLLAEQAARLLPAWS